MPPTADYSAIAKAILDQLSSQVGLATTLATAISGGLVALVIQIAIHNRTAGTTPLVLSAQWLIPLALLIEAVSLLSGYAARGAITDAAPILMQLPADSWHVTATPHEAFRFRDVMFQRRRALLVLLASVSALMLPQNVSAQDFNVGAEVAHIRASIGTELASPLARLGLLDFAGWFRAGRIATRPLGYEAGGQCTEGSERLMTTLNNLLPNLNPESILHSEPDRRLIEDLANAQMRNAATTKVVFSSVRKYAPPLQNLSDEQFTHFQLMIALILQDSNKDQFTQASAITFVYPFC